MCQPRKSPYKNKQVIHDIGFEEGRYLNALTKCQVNKFTGTISLYSGLSITNKTITFSHIIGSTTL